MSAENKASSLFFKPTNPAPDTQEQNASPPSIELPPQYLDEENKGRPDMVTCYRNLYPIK